MTDKSLDSLEVEFMTKAKFTKLIENAVRKGNLSHMDAIIHLCEKHSIEVEDCKKYISIIIKEKLEVEAMNLNYFPKVNELPVGE
tara:strand:- start:401 stop:655 length:255 start_codon:yes stop_codon:yes gene_type:complete